MDCTIDTTIIGFALRSNMEAIELLSQIRRNKHKVVFDSNGEINKEYSGCIKQAEIKKCHGCEMVESWLKHARSKGRIIYGDLSKKQKVDLLDLGFDPTDLKFVSACKFSLDKRLVADDTDYSSTVKEYLKNELSILVLHLNECLSENIFI